MKIALNALGKFSLEVAEQNVAYSRSLGFPQCEYSSGRPTLHVIGGGPSILDRIEEIRALTGDIWAINGTARWCREIGIDAAMFSCDPHVENVKHAGHCIMASCCFPEAFDAAKSVTVFDINRPGGISTGPSSATAALLLGPMIGYSRIEFWGCDSSSKGKLRHAYSYPEAERTPWKMRVESNGEVFDTEAGLLLQAEFLSAAMRLAPEVYVNQSSGLLDAMVKSGDHNVIWVCDEMANSMSAITDDGKKWLEERAA